MQSAVPLYQSSSDRPVPLRKRSDLRASKHVYRNQPTWIVKDPLAMEFYRLNDEEYVILELLDGQRSLSDIRRAFQRRFSPQRISERELQFFVTSLHEKSLVVSLQPDQGRHLLEQSREKRWKKQKSAIANLLAIRWRGVDPDRFLAAALPWLGWLFSGRAVVAALVLMLSALSWLTVHYTEFQSRLPALDEFFSQRNGWLLVAIVLITKVVHEFGHGICFKRLGGECHEIGVMLLFFMPTLYCNATDSWLMQSKWKRAAIGLAGIYVELIMASVATFLWWFSAPGIMNFICLDIMVTCSISAIVLNGNPLLRYDGYYIFSDLMEVPNLYARSGKVIHDAFQSYVLGMPQDSEPDSTLGTKLLLGSYRMSSTLYMLMIVVVILHALVALLRPFGLESIAIFAAVFSLFSLAMAPALAVCRGLEIPGSLDKMKWSRFVPSCAVVACGLALFLFVPFPHYVICSFTVEPVGAKAIYVEHEATLIELHVSSGQQVKAGQLLATLRNIDTELEIAALEGRQNAYESERDVLIRERHFDPAAASRLKEAQSELLTLQMRLTELRRVERSLCLFAPCDGQVIPAWTPVAEDTNLRQLRGWAGSALDAENLGTRFERGQLFCRVGSLSDIEAILAVDQGDVELVKVGQKASLQLDARSQTKYTGIVHAVSQMNSDRLPPSLALQHGGAIPTKRRPHSEELGSSEPADATFQARVALPEAMYLSTGLRGKAKVLVGQQTLAARSLRAFYRTFRLQL
jgi:putative peptide zinc metalloprotease protein